MRQTIIDGKKIEMMPHNIKITPLEAPKNNFFRMDSRSNYAFSRDTSPEEVRKVYRTMTNMTLLEKIADTISGIFNFPEGLDRLNMPQSYTDSFPLPFIPEYAFIRYEEYKTEVVKQ